MRPEIEIDGTLTRVLVEQVGPVDHSRLGDFGGQAGDLRGTMGPGGCREQVDGRGRRR